MAGSDWKEMELSSGVKVLYGPFPGGLYWDIASRALEEHPDPEPPTKEIDVVDGKETVGDLEDPAYKAALAVARNARYDVLGKAVLEMCVEPVGDYEPTVRRLAERWVMDPPPEDLLDRKVWFLRKWALRTAEDWGIIGRVQRFSQIEDEEVRQRAEFFRGNVAGTKGAGADAPGPAEGERLAVPGTAA